MKRWMLFSLLLTTACLSASLVVYFGYRERLPDPMPIHWNIEGKADGFQPRDQALTVLLMMPAGMTVMFVLALVLPWLSPRPFGVDTWRGTYEYVMVVLLGLFAYMHAVMLAGYLLPEMNMVRLLISGIFIFFALLGNVLGKVRRNFWVGVRTPWTLASETVWNRTHRVTAWLWTPLGLLGAAVVLLGGNLPACFIGLMIIAFIPVIYSLILYKRLEREGRLNGGESANL